MGTEYGSCVTVGVLSITEIWHRLLQLILQWVK